MVEVIVALTRPLRFGTVQLVPGGNQVPQKSYESIKGLGAFRKRVDAGAIIVRGDDGSIVTEAKGGAKRGRPAKSDAKPEAKSDAKPGKGEDAKPDGDAPKGNPTEGSATDGKPDASKAATE